MTLWLILTIMTAAAAIWASVPLIRRFDRSQAESVSDIEIYRDQLHEVEHELRQGLIDDTQAETIRVEIKRRILAAGSLQRTVTPKLSGGERNFAVICIAGIVVLGSVGLYAVTGSPELASWRASYEEEYSEVAQRGLTSLSSGQKGFAATLQTGIPESDAEPGPHAGLPSVEEMIQRLAARLTRNPQDTEGWQTLGWSYLNIGRFQEAAEAYARAIELDPDIAELRGDRVKALVEAADGVVTSEARTAIEDTLKLDPKNVQARFFLGLTKEQEGNKDSALAEWTELLKDTNYDEPWAAELKNRISELRRNMGVDGDSRPAEPKPVTAGRMRGITRAQGGSQTSAEVESGPSPADVRATQAVPPADRSLMIREMVDGLASRLEQSPRDADGWIKLIRSRTVLGESKLAEQALARGLSVFADDAGERDRIAAAAQQLGLNQ